MIEAKRGSKVICVNGAAAHLAREGDRVIIASFATYDESECKKHVPKLVYVDENNNITNIKPEPKKLQVARS